MPSPEEDINVNKPELETWMPAEYEARYEARFADASESLTATHCWQAGWQDADLELTESFGQKLEGDDARAHGIPFGEDRTEPWKLGWIDVDIRLGTMTKH
jgi:hypothetical protein